MLNKIEIRLNELDKNDYQQNVFVSSEKLKEIIDFEAIDKIKELDEKYSKLITTACKEYNIDVVIIPHDSLRIGGYVSLLKDMYLDDLTELKKKFK